MRIEFSITAKINLVEQSLANDPIGKITSGEWGRQTTPIKLF